MRARRRAAAAHNERLGAAVLTHVAKVKPTDARVLKVLTAAPLATDLGRIAARGARLCLPGCLTQETRKDGTSRTVYAAPCEAEAEAREFLRGAGDAADVAGRCLALLALARRGRPPTRLARPPGDVSRGGALRVLLTAAVLVRITPLVPSS